MLENLFQFFCLSLLYFFGRVVSVVNRAGSKDR